MSSELTPARFAFKSSLSPQNGSFGRAWRAFQATQADGNVPPGLQDWPSQVCSVIVRAGSNDLEQLQGSPQQRIMEACSHYTMALATMAIDGPWRITVGHLGISLLVGPLGPVRSGPALPVRPEPPAPRRRPLPALLDTSSPAQLHAFASNLYDKVRLHGVSLQSTIWCLSMALSIDKALSQSHARYGEARFDHLQLHTGKEAAAAILVLRDPLQHD